MNFLKIKPTTSDSVRWQMFGCLVVFDSQGIVSLEYQFWINMPPSLNRKVFYNER